MSEERVENLIQPVVEGKDAREAVEKTSIAPVAEVSGAEVERYANEAEKVVEAETSVVAPKAEETVTAVSIDMGVSGEMTQATQEEQKLDQQLQTIQGEADELAKTTVDEIKAVVEDDSVESGEKQEENSVDNRFLKDDLSPSDFVEIYASKVFKDDEIGKRLLEEELLRGLLVEERQELTDKLEGKETPVPLEVVKLYEGKHVIVDASQTEENPQFLLTNRLNGCVATVLLSQDSVAARREAVLTHFPPFLEDRNIEKIKSLVTPEMKSGGNKKIVVYCQEKRSGGIDKFVERVKEAYGDDAEVEIVKYNKQDKKDDGVLLVRIPKQSTEPVSIHHPEGDMNV